MVVGNFASENAVAFEPFDNDARIADNFASTRFDRFLVFGVAVEIVDTVFEGRRCNVVEKPSESLFLVVSEVPDDKRDTYAVREDIVEMFKVKNATIVEANHADARKTLHFWSGDVFE